jgi:hypothetical protein
MIIAISCRCNMCRSDWVTLPPDGFALAGVALTAGAAAAAAAAAAAPTVVMLSIRCRFAAEPGSTFARLSTLFDVTLGCSSIDFFGVAAMTAVSVTLI